MYASSPPSAAMTMTLSHFHAGARASFHSCKCTLLTFPFFHSLSLFWEGGQKHTGLQRDNRRRQVTTATSREGQEQGLFMWNGMVSEVLILGKKAGEDIPAVAFDKLIKLNATPNVRHYG